MRGYIPIPVPGPRSRKVEPQHVPFPGFQEAFNSEWPEKPVAVIQDIQLQEIEEKITYRTGMKLFMRAWICFVSRLEAEENRLEAPPSFWFVIIPEIIYELGRPQSRLARAEAVIGTQDEHRGLCSCLRWRDLAGTGQRRDPALEAWRHGCRKRDAARMAE
jgi:hypothetical protein